MTKIQQKIVNNVKKSILYSLIKFGVITRERPVRIPDSVYTTPNPAYVSDEFYSFFLTHSLEKVFPNKKPEEFSAQTLYCLQGEVPSLQLVYHYQPGKYSYPVRPEFTVTVTGAPVPARIRTVELIPSDYPCHDLVDDNYLSYDSGLFPDMLKDLENGKIQPTHNQYRSLWIDFPLTGQAEPGEYLITITLDADETLPFIGFKLVNPRAKKQRKTLNFTLKVLSHALPPQKTFHTEWLYADCIADYYQTPVFSETHWQFLEQFIAMAAQEHRVNTLLTPVVTPPLNTAIGGERTTVQLVDVYMDEQENYSFGFEKLKRWCILCDKYGITHLEICHLFTQWGAFSTPKIIAQTPSGERKIFDWNVDSGSKEYRRFLESFIPALRNALEEYGYNAKHLFFHISDEPLDPAHTDSFRKAKRQLEGLLDDCTIIDAASDLSFYTKGLISHPIPANNEIQIFIDHGVEDLWVYYCTMQGVSVPNRFFAMPSARNRIMGLLMYLFDIKGFLHWGYNFYNSTLSEKNLNPFYETSAERTFPSGDSYLVYPGKKGVPYSSIRAEVQRAAIDDIRALQLLESFIGKEKTRAIIFEGVEGDITFTHYPKNAAYLLNLHERICKALENL